MLYFESSKYRHLVYYYLVITPFFVVLGTNAVCDRFGLAIVLLLPAAEYRLLTAVFLPTRKIHR